MPLRHEDFTPRKEDLTEPLRFDNSFPLEWNCRTPDFGDLTLQNSWPRLHDPEEVPKAELNPLLNPLLERNLGRWAQVYFTHSPETRERAVLDLLRELDNEVSAGQRLPPSAAPVPASPRTADSVFCSACDRENRP